MALTDIVERILADASAQADFERRDAEHQAEAILAAGRLEAAARADAALEQAAGRLEAEKNSRLAGVRLAARSAVLALRRELVQDIFVQMSEALTRRPPEEYAAFLAALVPAQFVRDEAAVQFGRGDLARTGTRLPELVAAALVRRHPKWRFTLSDEPGDFDAGLQVRDARSVHHLSLETLLAERQAQGELEVNRILFAP